MDKKGYTRLFLEQAKLDTSDTSIKSFHRSFWYAPYSPVGLRLSDAGAVFLTHVLDLESYTYKMKDGPVKSSKIVILMNKHLSQPFCVWRNQIQFFGETDAIMLAMMSGDINQYLENFSR